MKIVKGLVANSISGSNRSEHNGVPLIAVTGSVVFGRNPDNHEMPGSDVFFHISGMPGDATTVTSVGGDFTVTGSVNLLDDIFVPNGTVHIGDSPEQFRLLVDNATASIVSDVDFNISSTNVVVDASDGRIQFQRDNNGYLTFDMIPGDNDILIESDGMLVLQGTKITNNSLDGEISFQTEGQDKILIEMDALTNESIIRSNEVLVLSGSEINLNSSAGEIRFQDAEQERLLIDLNTDQNVLFLQSKDALILSGSSISMDSSAGQFVFNSNGIDFLSFNATTNQILPAADNAIDLGSSQYRFANVYTGDLHLRNDRGHWQIVEEADCLTIYNRLTDVRYKFVLERYDD
jgi:hypothetical protein